MLENLVLSHFIVSGFDVTVGKMGNNENILIEPDKYGNLVSMIIGHAQEKADMLNFSYQQVAT